MYQLELPWFLLLLPLPLLVWWLLPASRQPSASIRLPFFNQVAAAAGVQPGEGAIVAKAPLRQVVVLGLAWCLVVLALARPQLVEPPIEKSEPQRDILLALDLSQSMDTKDFPAPSGEPEARVEAVKQVVSDFIAKRTGDRIALIAFGDAPYPLAPFTMDHGLVQSMVADLLPGIAGPRTALGDTLGLAIRMFEKTNVPEKVLILLTDGNDTVSKMPPLKAAETAHAKNIVVHTVAIGDPQASGENKVDVATLQQIASSTGGQYFFGADQTALAAIYTELDRITPENQKVLSWRPRIDLFQWPLAAAFLLMAGYYFLSAAWSSFQRRAA
ncbi:VWA domain-containing protein [Aureimonas fodinaquatilis]|uniref:VWA domain-containing protein n=1 Tax=Aureimonas fodinaquatilis TaxID=2565783 RepID=A0A5B0DQ63_9HYPH|nr:VWA domain-containing protein [Aureimonas fodinaquatilis]KAA0968914.1 VWA domain-containing protein [Aureimonas fodinaquatilis]